MTQYQAPPAGPHTPASPGQHQSPKNKRGLVIGLVVALVVLVGAGAGLFLFVKGGDTEAPAGVDNSAFLSASSPTERLEAAVDQTLAAGPMRVTTVTDGVESTAHVDYPQQIVLTEMPAGPGMPAAATVLMRGGDVLIRLDSAQDGMEAGVWYRMPVEETGMGAMMASSFDAEAVRKLVSGAEDTVESGSDEINGVSATRFVVTPDKDAYIDNMFSMMGVPEDEPTLPQLRAALFEQVPNELEYWVDDSGMLVRENDGTQVKTYSEFGEPFEVPEIDEAAVQQMPGI